MLLKIYFIDYAITVVPFFSPLYSSLPVTAPPPSVPPNPALSLCPWVIHINSLASPFPILFVTSPCLFCTYHLCFLFPVPFPPSFSHPHSLRPQFISLGRTYKFFGFSISYTILNLPLSILYLPFILLTPCTFSSIFLCPP